MWRIVSAYIRTQAHWVRSRKVKAGWVWFVFFFFFSFFLPLSSPFFPGRDLSCSMIGIDILTVVCLMDAEGICVYTLWAETSSSSSSSPSSFSCRKDSIVWRSCILLSRAQTCAPYIIIFSWSYLNEKPGYIRTDKRQPTVCKIPEFVYFRLSTESGGSAITRSTAFSSSFSSSSPIISAFEARADISRLLFFLIFFFWSFFLLLLLFRLLSSQSCSTVRILCMALLVVATPRNRSLHSSTPSVGRAEDIAAKDFATGSVIDFECPMPVSSFRTMTDRQCAHPTTACRASSISLSLSLSLSSAPTWEIGNLFYDYIYSPKEYFLR